MRWFIPCTSGDYRLTDKDDGTCLLSIEHPNASEKRVLTLFAEEAPPSWGIVHRRITSRTRREFVVHAPARVVAPFLLEISRRGEVPTGKLWTGVVSTNGKVTLIEHDQDETITLPPDTKDAATIREPYRGCPEPEPCNARASEVLRAFMTPSQWASWQAEQFFDARGSHTKRVYRVYHRNRAAALRMAHTVVRPDGDTLCAYNPTLPAEEEALGLKWLVEHAEHTIDD